ncbi:MAG: MarC family protein [Vannielia sp.]|uniref:MarC family protein n=1 Tax=Rhodobacterales TaxID=204455 RepID=UPI0020954CE4|nr:MarC family protein [Oceanicola sp. 502str15]MCO6381681.1 NAAT family transporter [Oceanicola sp. 502str15]
MDTAFLISAFVTLFVVIDPLGLAPLFAALTQDDSPARRRAIAFRSVAIGFALLCLFGIAGEAVLGFVGISMPAFRIAGGLLLFLTALEMLFERRTKRREDQTEEDRPDPSIFPLATPLIAGPGAIASMILLSGAPNATWSSTLQVIAVMATVLALVLILFLGAGLLQRLLGKTGINVATRLLGMLLAALSVQFVIDGLRDLSLL